jgi:ABC-type dipeptide/oligopeptide/nickel transport system permease subunit
MKKKNRRLENVLYELRHNKQAIFAATYLLVIILISIFIVFVNVDPDAIDVTNKLQGPSAAHWFGTDEWAGTILRVYCMAAEYRCWLVYWQCLLPFSLVSALA